MSTAVDDVTKSRSTVTEAAACSDQVWCLRRLDIPGSENIAGGRDKLRWRATEMPVTKSSGLVGFLCRNRDYCEKTVQRRLRSPLNGSLGQGAPIELVSSTAAKSLRAF